MKHLPQRERERERERERASTLTVEAENVVLPILDLHCVDCWQVVEPDKTQGQVLTVN